MIKLSVIIPMYNVEQYIETCIQSVYKQHIDTKEFEVILVDDESPDNSLQVAEKTTASFDNVKIISQKNKGLGGARNTGIKHAAGKYILFLDSDDFYIDNTIKEIINIADENDLDILEFGARGVDINDTKVFELAIKNDSKIVTGIEYYNSFKYMNSACNKLYKRAFIEKNNLRFIEKIYSEDFEFNTRALYYCNRVMAVDNLVAKFLQSDGSITRSKDLIQKKKYINDLIDIIKRINIFKNEQVNNKRGDQDLFFEERLTMVCINIFYQMFKYNFPYSEIVKIKKQLISLDLLKITHSVSDKQRNFFRKYFLGFNFIIYRSALTLKRLF